MLIKFYKEESDESFHENKVSSELFRNRDRSVIFAYNHFTGKLGNFSFLIGQENSR